jgi:hypothetical protein
VVAPPLGRDGHKAWLEAEVSGPAWLGFSVYNGNHKLVCRPDDQLVTSLEDEYLRDEWRRFLVYAPPGDHRFRWELEIPPSYSNSFGGSRLDALTITPIDPANDLVAALNLPPDHVALSVQSETPLAQSLVSRDGLAVQLAFGDVLALTFEEEGVLEWWQRSDSTHSADQY